MSAVLYQGSGFKVTSPERISLDRWCRKDGINSQIVSVFYSVPHRERETLLGSDYEAFVRDIVYPNVMKHCGEISLPKVAVRFAHDGSTETWDSMTFEIADGGGRVAKTAYYPSKDAEGAMTMAEIRALTPSTGSRNQENLAKIAERKRKVSAWGGDCSGPFCNLQGGAYLNAIYNNDTAAIRRMDGLANAGLQAMAQRVLGNSDMAKLMERFRQREAPNATLSLLPILADNYLHAYQHRFGFKCPDGLVRKHYRWTGDLYETYVGLIYTGQVGGEQRSASYVIQPAMVPLCDKVCNHMGGEAGRQSLQKINHEPSLLTLYGLDDMPKRYGCSDASVAQFERNLSSLTNAYLANKADWSKAN